MGIGFAATRKYSRPPLELGVHRDGQTVRLGKASLASSARYDSARSESYRAEIPKLGPEPD